MKGFLLQNGTFLSPSAGGCDVRAAEHFHKAEELKMKMHQRALCYLQDPEVLEPSEVHLGDPGNVISVQVTAIESKFGSDFFFFFLQVILMVYSTQAGLKECCLLSRR